jgi:hypothetical protein
MPRYLIKPGASFRLDNDTVVEGPAEIELDDDVARMHASLVTLVTTPQPEAAPAADPKQE